jgi:hypothetical protein
MHMSRIPRYRWLTVPLLVRSVDVAAESGSAVDDPLLLVGY